jgi:putative addiction module component (TIGR02574 family)
MAAYIDDILKLPVDERLEILEKIWESLGDEIPYAENEILLARERYEEYKKKP